MSGTGLADRPGRLVGAPHLARGDGTNGKTTTTSMLETIVSADGRAAAAMPEHRRSRARTDAGRTAAGPECCRCQSCPSFQLHVGRRRSCRPRSCGPQLRRQGTTSTLAPGRSLAYRGDLKAGALAMPCRCGKASTMRWPPCNRDRTLHPARVGFTLGGVPGDGTRHRRVTMLVDRAFGGGTLLPTADVRPTGPSGGWMRWLRPRWRSPVGVAPSSVTAGVTLHARCASR